MMLIKIFLIPLNLLWPKSLIDYKSKFFTRIAEASKNLATKTQVENALGLGDKKREKKKLQTFDLSYFISKNYFNDNGSQNYWIFQPDLKYFQIFSGTVDNLKGWWKSKGLSEESITTPATLDNSFATKLSYIHNSKIAVKFQGNCLKQKKVIFYSWKSSKRFYFLWIKCMVTSFTH